MKKILILLIITKFNLMYTQKSKDIPYDIISIEESLKYDVQNMKEYGYSQYNASTALYIDENRILFVPNLHDGSCLITSKAEGEKMFTNNSFPLLAENDTAYFRFKNWMNKDEFNRKNIDDILADIGLIYKADTFYNDAEKLSKTLSEDDRKKLLIAMLYIMGEDLRKLCPDAKWSFETRYYFQPFDEPILYYEDHSFSFIDLNILLDRKLLGDKKITFKNIYKKVEDGYAKQKWQWSNH
ncbi:hypothetical protein ACMGDK_09535 [Chryseobacterium sp. DT-3]|uniref:hypothetical protein n=1 Tax=Chryseobacterium sp. DT-3 TaxID=3396164 RepID=UPI003F1C81AE